MRFDYRDTIYFIEEDKVIYYGFRPQDSLYMHEAFANKGKYPFSFPSHSLYMLIDITRRCNKLYRKNDRFIGMNPRCKSDFHIFDSHFEGGNLDTVVKVKKDEYDLYIRTDSNTRGHHQWFYFSVQPKIKGTVKFNIVNLTQKESLYTQGMKIAIYSEGIWHRGGENITYKQSKLAM